MRDREVVQCTPGDSTKARVNMIMGHVKYRNRRDRVVDLREEFVTLVLRRVPVTPRIDAPAGM